MFEGWVVDEALSLMGDANCLRVEEAFARPDAVVFGWCYWYAGGRSRDRVLATSIGDYRNALARMRPGDLLTLYYLDDVRHLALTTRRPGDAGGKSWREHEETGFLRADPRAEGLFIGIGVSVDGASVWAVELNEPDDSDWDEVDLLTAASQEVLLFNLTDSSLDADEQGSFITPVSAADRRRVHALVDAKFPAHPSGAVPLSGPY